MKRSFEYPDMGSIIYLPLNIRRMVNRGGAWGKWGDVGQGYKFPTCTVPENSIGEGNGTPLQYSCLETPMDGGGW